MHFYGTCKDIWTNVFISNHLWPVFSFYTPWKHSTKPNGNIGHKCTKDSKPNMYFNMRIPHINPLYSNWRIVLYRFNLRTKPVIEWLIMENVCIDLIWSDKWFVISVFLEIMPWSLFSKAVVLWTLETFSAMWYLKYSLLYRNNP